MGRGHFRIGAVRAILFAGLVMLLATPQPAALAAETPELARGEFELVWERTEAPVAGGDTQRSWLWGPEPRTAGLEERYLDSPEQSRTVQYFDKGRMEVNDPEANPEDPWFVTSGLLTRELISGEIQIGDESFLETGQGASIHVAGDPMNPFPQYRHLADLVDEGNPDRTGERADKVLTPDGMIEDESHPDDPNAEFVHHIVYLGPESVDVGYNIPLAFWEYLNAPGTVYDSLGNPAMAEPLFEWIYVMGFPISDPFWAQVPVDGEIEWVLIQPFERRVLTYTPSNSPEWQVEMGNIGQHYRDWRTQFFPEGAEGGDPAFYGLPADATWRYGTSRGVDENWEMVEFSQSFIPGSTLYARQEAKLEGRRTSYWSAGPDGLYLHGWEIRDGQRNVREMVVYSPAIHVLPDEREQQVLESETLAISMNHPPETATIEVTVGPRQLVSTPAGVFRTWRMESIGFDNPAIDHHLGNTFWFEPGVGIVQWLNDDFSAYLLETSLLGH